MISALKGWPIDAGKQRIIYCAKYNKEDTSKAQT